MAVLVRLGIKEKWVYKNSSESKVKRVRNELLREEQYKTLYEKELKTSWDGEEINVRGGACGGYGGKDFFQELSLGKQRKW